MHWTLYINTHFSFIMCVCVCVCVSLLAASVCNTTHAERICQIELTWTSLTLTLHWSATPGRRLLTAFLTWRVILRVYWHTLFENVLEWVSECVCVCVCVSHAVAHSVKEFRAMRGSSLSHTHAHSLSLSLSHTLSLSLLLVLTPSAQMVWPWTLKREAKQTNAGADRPEARWRVCVLRGCAGARCCRPSSLCVCRSVWTRIGFWLKFHRTQICRRSVCWAVRRSLTGRS